VTQTSADANRNRTSIPAGSAGDPAVKRREILTFLILAFVIWPFLAVAVVGGFGFLVWIYQMIAGPPGPPPV
jgi:nitrate reductase NapE